MKKVMVFGTFDSLHPGHLNFFKQAKRIGNYLIVVVARDVNVKKIKGQLPRFNEDKRLSMLLAAEIADIAILGQIRNPYAVIRKYRPAIIALGYDQNSFTADLKKQFPNVKIVRLKPYKPEIYKSSITNKKLKK